MMNADQNKKQVMNRQLKRSNRSNTSKHQLDILKDVTTDTLLCDVMDKLREATANLKNLEKKPKLNVETLRNDLNASLIKIQAVSEKIRTREEFFNNGMLQLSKEIYDSILFGGPNGTNVKDTSGIYNYVIGLNDCVVDHK